MKLTAVLALLTLASCENRYTGAERTDRGRPEEEESTRGGALFGCGCGDVLYCPSCWLESCIEAERRGQPFEPMPPDLKEFLGRYPKW